MHRISRSGTRLSYFLHRWLGTLVGAMVFVWFASGIAMMYYPWPAITESQETRRLEPFDPPSTLIGFSAAYAAAAISLRAGGSSVPLVSGRLRKVGDQLLYQFFRDAGGGVVATALVDAQSGLVLSPISAELAQVEAQREVGHAARVERVDLLREGDHYLLSLEYAAYFPAYRVRFADPSATAVYVSVAGGEAFGIVTRLTRFTTWTGTVPHWLYFQWLYHRYPAWNATILVAGSAAILLAITGIIWGTTQLFARRGDGRLSPYRGISRWHHLAGITFGVLVLTWALSGVWQNLGEGNSPRAGQAARLRGGLTRWDAIRLSEAEALRLLRRELGSGDAPLAVDLLQFDGRPGFRFLFRGQAVWLDAESGQVRTALDEASRLRAARLLMGDSVPVAGVELIDTQDDYYYARHGREVLLPAVRVSFGDPAGTRFYFDPVSGVPTGFVDGNSKRSRWLRDALHSFDFAALNNRRPLWDLVILPLLLGGLLSSGSGVVLLARRLSRRRRADPGLPGE